MMLRWQVFFQNLKLKRKVLLISALAGFVPLCLLTIFSLVIIQRFTSEAEKNKNTDNLTSAYQQINSTLSTYEEALSFIVNNDQLQRGISLKDPSNYDQYNLYIHTIVPLFNSITAQQPNIKNITLYTSMDIFNHGNFVKKFDERDLTRYFIFNQTTTPEYFYDRTSERIYLYSQLFSRQSDETHLIVFELDPKIIFKNLENISNEDYRLTVTDPLSRNLFYHSSINEQSDFLTSWLGLFFKGEDINQRLLANRWVIELSRPVASMYRGTFLLILIAGALVLFSLLVLFISLWSLSKSVVSPLQKLVNEMAQADEEDFLDHQLHYESNDEIGQLYEAFNDMLGKIKILIDEVYQGEINQKKHELRALQAQINPHFFYNSLSLISNKAVMTGNTEISEMAQLLSKFYRLSLNNGKNRLSIRQEMDLTITYAQIQLKMHRNSFDLITEIDEDILDFEIMNLLIQPFVENAIFHGIDHIEDDRRGKLIVKGYESQDMICFEVIDNGAGMTKDALDNIMQRQKQHYGIYNVQQRIALYYNKEDGISYESQVQKGTKVTVRLPKDQLIEK